MVPYPSSPFVPKMSLLMETGTEERGRENKPKKAADDGPTHLANKQLDMVVGCVILHYAFIVHLRNKQLARNLA